MLRNITSNSSVASVSLPNQATLQAQHQLREDWDNREVINLISYHIKKCSDFLSEFEHIEHRVANEAFTAKRETFGTRTPSDLLKPTLLAEKHSAEIMSLACVGQTLKAGSLGRPLVSQDRAEVRRRVLYVYKVWMKWLPYLWDRLVQYNIPLTEFKLMFKAKWLQNAHVEDVLVIDRLCGRAELALLETRKGYYNPDHVYNMLVRKNVQDAKPDDFLSKFFAGKD